MKGRIVASASGPALSGIEVQAGDGSGVLLAGFTTYTDNYGYFEIPGITNEEVTLYVTGAPSGRENGYVQHFDPGPSLVVPTFLEANVFDAHELGDIILDVAPD